MNRKYYLKEINGLRFDNTCWMLLKIDGKVFRISTNDDIVCDEYDTMDDAISYFWGDDCYVSIRDFIKNNFIKEKYDLNRIFENCSKKFQTMLIRNYSTKKEIPVKKFSVDVNMNVYKNYAVYARSCKEAKEKIEKMINNGRVNVFDDGFTATDYFRVVVK